MPQTFRPSVLACFGLTPQISIRNKIWQVIVCELENNRYPGWKALETNINRTPKRFAVLL